MKIALRRHSSSLHILCAFLLTLGVFFLAILSPGRVEARTPGASVDASTLVMLTNEDRVASGAKALLEDALLSAAAQRKADDMAKRGYFSHISPNGNKPWSWLISSNYYYTRAGENLAEGFTTSEGVAQAWMQSPSHRANIVDRSYTRVGFGIAHGFYQGRQTTFVVQFFATPYVSKISAAGRVARK